jgi:hypothetical protein
VGVEMIDLACRKGKKQQGRVWRGVERQKKCLPSHSHPSEREAGSNCLMLRNSTWDILRLESFA